MIFYVYVLGDIEQPDYIGKGSGRRLKQSERQRGVPGCEIARFKREADAYAFEREKIAELAPGMNKSPGGYGGVATRRRKPRTATRYQAAKILMERVGSAGLLDYVDVTTIKQIESIYYGTECHG